MRKFEYVWLDGYKPTQSLRSKVKIDDYADVWSFDGSSTQQATGDNSDCILIQLQSIRLQTVFEQMQHKHVQAQKGLM